MADAIVLIPVYNAMGTLHRCVMSALRQRDVDIRIIAIDHGSADGSAKLIRQIASRYPEVRLVQLQRVPGEPRSPCRPLNAGIDTALDVVKQLDSTWIYRLDTDDVLGSDDSIARQLARGGRAAFILSTLVFFDQREQLAFEYGALADEATVGAERLDLVSVAHHASAMRADLLAEVRSRWGTCYDVRLRYGEDIDLTCKLIRQAGLAGCRSVPAPLCYKRLASETLTESLPMRDIVYSYRLLLRQHEILRHRYVARDIWETAAGRVAGATFARRLARGRLGREGHPSRFAFGAVADRLDDLAHASQGPGFAPTAQ